MSVGPAGPQGAPGLGSALISFNTQNFGQYISSYLLGVLLANPTGSGLLILGTGDGYVPANTDQTTLDVASNAMAFPCPIKGTLSQLTAKLNITLQGDGTLSDDIVFKFTIYTAPSNSFSSNDFTASPITASITVPKGTAGGGSGVGTTLFLSAQDTSHNLAVVAGQRILMHVDVITNQLGNASSLVQFLAIGVSSSLGA